MSAILVGPVTMRMFGYCVMQVQYARVLPVYHAAIFVMTRARRPVNVSKFSRRVRAPKYVHLYYWTKSSSRDEIANVNCFTISDTYSNYNRFAPKLWNKHSPHSLRKNGSNGKAKLKR